MKLLSTAPSDSIQVLPIVDKFEIIAERLEDSNGRDNLDDGFYVCDVGDIIKKHQRWQKNFPRITPHYAIKCNSDPVLLKTLVNLGTGFDCASKVEVRQMLNLGAQPDQIIFAHPCKQSSHIRYARDNNVKLTVFDNAEELVKLKKTFPTAQLVLRIQTDDSASLCRLSMKFGAPIESCRGLIDTAYHMGFNVVGISFHVGSNCQDAKAFIKPIQDARELFDYAKTVGYNFNLLDIGGGFPGTENVKLKFEEIAEIVNKHLDKSFPAYEHPNLRIIAEPGRFYAASAFTLVTNIIAKRKVVQFTDTKKEERFFDPSQPDKEKKHAFMYYINDGLYGAFNCLFYDHAVVTPVLLKSRSPSEIEHPSSIWGPTCDGLDKVLENIALPELDAMEWIVWPDMGAYTIPCSSSFNGFKSSKVHYVISEKQYAALRDNIVEGLDFVGDVVEKEDLNDKAVSKLAMLSSDGRFTHTDLALPQVV